MAQDVDTSRQIEELRRVLLKPQALVDRISPVIADILAEKIGESRDDIARALAPAIGEAIRHQVYQAREDIIDALYPVIGQMIARATSEAIRNLAQQIDARLRAGTVWLDPGYWQARARGIAPAEYRMRQALPLRINEIFLIQRDSGLLICHYSNGAEPPDRDLVSGMLTAIRDFAREAFGRVESGELGGIAYESRQILIEAGGTAYLAVVIEGVEPADFRQVMRTTLAAIHERRYERLRAFDGSDSALSSESRAILSQRLLVAEAGNRRLSRSQRLIIVALLLFVLLPPMLFCGWAWQVEARLAVLTAPTSTPTASPLPTATSIPTATNTPIPTPTNTPQPTNTPPPSPTRTPSPSPTRTPQPTRTPSPTPTRFTGVMIGNVYLFSTPDESSARSSIVAPLGAPVELLAVQGDWYRVRVALSDGNSVELIGWVPSRWVRLLRPAPSEIITPVATP